MATTAAANSATAAFNTSMYKTQKVIFLKQEKILLTDLVKSQLPSDISSKAKQPVVLRRKAKAWELITSAYNATAPVSGPRTVKQLQKLWENLTGVAKRNEAKRRNGLITSSSGLEEQRRHPIINGTGICHQQDIIASQYNDVDDRLEQGVRGVTSSSSNGDIYDEDEDEVPIMSERLQLSSDSINDMISKHTKRRPPTSTTDSRFHSAKTRSRQATSFLISSSSSFGGGLDVSQEILAMRRREHVAKMEKIELEKQKLHIERDYWTRRYEQDFGCNNYDAAHHTSTVINRTTPSPHVWVPSGNIETGLTSGVGTTSMQLSSSSGISQSSNNTAN